MSTSVKKKIWFGTGFLFFLLILMGGIGIYFTAKLKNEARAAVKDNYESLSYCHVIQKQLDSIRFNYSRSIQQFGVALNKQERNVTEPGEATATRALRQHFNRLRAGDSSQVNVQTIEKELQTILTLNMNAISNKNSKAQSTAERALTIIIALAAGVFLIAFTFTVNFPTIVTAPISQLAAAIREITNKNYKYRVHIERDDEFGELAGAFNNMASRLEYFESSNLNKLMFEKNRAEAVINSLKDASIGIDKDNVILFANQQALQLLGLSVQAVVGNNIEALSKTNDLFRFLINNESSSPFKVVIDNRENYFIKEMVDEAQSNSKVIVIKNITSFKELDVAKTNFIATISHELKTPLAASDFSLKLLEDERIGSLTNEQKDLIQNLKQDNQRILRIISELLNMSQIEAGRIQLNTQLVSPYSIVDNAIETVAANARNKNITIDRALEDGVPDIYVDADKTTWVLNNLLSNAIKYSNDSTRVTVQVHQDNNHILFSVTDTGPGIAPQYLSRIFERYFQVPGTKAKGTGLGLAISKDFIEAQKGTISVQSEPGTGSVFSFSLPLQVI